VPCSLPGNHFQVCAAHIFKDEMQALVGTFEPTNSKVDQPIESTTGEQVA